MKIEDWIGRRFGIREVIGSKIQNRNRLLVMRCDCGNVSLADRHSLKAGRSLSCVKCKKKTGMVTERKRPVVKDRKYRKFLSFADKCKHSGKSRINVQCICGNVSTVALSAFNAGNAEKCGACGQLQRTNILGLNPHEEIPRYLTEEEKERLRDFVRMAKGQRKLAEKINVAQSKISRALSDKHRIPSGHLMRSLDKISAEMKENKNA